MAGAAMRSQSPNRLTPAEIAEAADKKAERQAIKAEIATLQAIIDGISAATTLADLRGYVKDLTRSTKRIARILT